MNATIHLPQWCVDIIANPPRSGEGFHRWLFRAARALWKCRRSEHDIRAVLMNAAESCGRRVQLREIEDALRDSRTNAFQCAHSRLRPWPCVDSEQREAITKMGDGVVGLWESSPVRIEENSAHTEEIIDRLFPGNPLLCVGSANNDCRTASREKWRGKLASFAFLVPSPMTSTFGRNQRGEESNRCLDNTGTRRFLVVEFDAGSVDDHAALLLHLAERAPLALAVFSGSKSLHGWFYCAGIGEHTVLRFFRYAVSVGADHAMWPRCQLARMPDGIRENGTRQVVYFFNPGVLK